MNLQTSPNSRLKDFYSNAIALLLALNVMCHWHRKRSNHNMEAKGAALDMGQIEQVIEKNILPATTEKLS
jgi:hypothetical protein